MNTKISIMRLAASVLAIAVAGSLAPTAALAQQAPADEGGLAEIIVTASKRATNLQKESRAVTVVGAEDLERAAIVEPSAIQALVPGLTIARNGQQMQVFIRGVGDKTINAATDPAVALNVDGVYYPKSYEATGAFFDLERIEVLKGPQGTLYGRNASAGAVNLITARPRFELGGFVEGEYGNFDNKRLAAAINLPISDVVAFRFSGQVIDRDGYLSDGYNNAKSEAFRASLLVQSTPDTSLLVTGSFAHLGGQGDAGVIVQRFGTTAPATTVPNPSNPWAGPTDPATIRRIAATNPGNEGFVFANGYQDLDVYTLNATFEHHMDAATLTIAPSYVGSHFVNYSDAALVVPTFQDTISHQYGLEARLASPDGSRHKWVLGVMGMGEDVKDYYQSVVALGGGAALYLPAESPRRDDRTLAAFGELNFSATDTLRLIAGARYTWEKKIVTGATLSFPPMAQNSYPAPFTGQFPFDIRGKVTTFPGALDIGGQKAWNAFNFRAGVEYDVTPTAMVYATVATGFKAGGFYNDVSPRNSYNPEKLTSYQAGVKSRFLGNRLQFNLEAFYWDYTDKQETFLGCPSFGCASPILLTQNAAKAELYGFDATLAAQVTPNDTISADVEYNHTKYGSYVVSTLFGPVDNTGRALVRAPQWSGRVSYEHRQPLGDLGEISLNGSMRFSSSYWLSNDFVPIGLHPAYQMYDASLTWTSASKRVSLTAYGKNLADKAYYSGAIFSPSLGDAGVGQIGDPRTYGVRAKISF